MPTIYIPFKSPNAFVSSVTDSMHEMEYINITNPQSVKKIKQIYIRDLIIPNTYRNITAGNSIAYKDSANVNLTTGVYLRKNYLSQYATDLGVTLNTSNPETATSLEFEAKTSWTLRQTEQSMIDIAGWKKNGTTLSSTSNKITISDPAGHTLVKKNIIVVSAGNNILPIVYNSTNYNVELTPLLYTTTTLATEIQTELKAQVNSGFSASQSSDVLTISHSSVAWSFNWADSDYTTAGSLYHIIGGSNKSVGTSWTSARTMDINPIRHIDVYSSVSFKDQSNTRIIFTIPIDSSIATFSKHYIKETEHVQLNGITLSTINLLFCANGRQLDLQGIPIIGVLCLEY